MNKIIYIDWGGLGDHLQFSTLPENFHKQGHKTYISNFSKYRRSDIKELVWGSNPYISGFSSEIPNVGHLGVSIPMDNKLSMNHNWEILSGIQWQDSTMHMNYPIIYKDPNYKEEFHNALLIDLNTHALAGSIAAYEDSINQHISKVLATEVYTNVYIIDQASCSYSLSTQNINIPNSINIQTKDIFDYYNTVASCKKIICVASGSHVMAVAIKNKHNPLLKIDCFSDFGEWDGYQYQNKSFFWWDTVNYYRKDSYKNMLLSNYKYVEYR